MEPAPGFSLKDQNDTDHSLSEYAGKWLVLYFYPKDETSGCTKEACSFRDAKDVIASEGHAVVVGVSKDSVASHQAFTAKHHLNFTLLSDPDHQVIEAYRSWGPKKFLGQEFLGTQRNTFIINPEGQIVKKYEGVDPGNHADQIISDLKTLQQK